MKYQGIYKIRNLKTGKVYIGQSKDIDKRFNYHKKYAINYNKSHYLYRAINKYGIDNFEFIVLEWIKDASKLNEAEQYWMDFYNSYNPEFGYNLRPKAESNRGMKCSEEHKAKVGLKAKARWKNPDYKESVASKLRGQKRSKEFCKKLAEIQKNREIPEGCKKTMFVKGQKAWNKGMKFSAEWKNKIGEASKKMWADPKFKEKMKEVHKGKVLSEEHKNNITKGLIKTRKEGNTSFGFPKGNVPWNKKEKVSI